MGRMEDDIDLVVFEVKEGREWTFGVPDYLIGDAETMPADIVAAVRNWCQEAEYWCVLVEDAVLAIGRRDILEHYDPLIDAILWYGPMQNSDKNVVFFTCPLDTPWVEGEMILDHLDMLVLEMGYEIVPLPDEQLKNELCTDTLWSEDKGQATHTQMTVLWPVDMLDENK